LASVQSLTPVAHYVHVDEEDKKYPV